MLRDEARVVFAQRLITRAADAGGEDHIAISAEEFAQLRNAGDLLLHWQAHGLDYGLSGKLAVALKSGLCVVANPLPGTRLLAGDPPAALIVDSIPALTALVTRLVNDRDEVDRLGAAARARFVERFSMGTVSTATDEVYATVLARRRRVDG